MGMVWVLLSKFYFGYNSKINALKFEVPDGQIQIETLSISDIKGADTEIREGRWFLGASTLYNHLLP